MCCCVLSGPCFKMEMRETRPAPPPRSVARPSGVMPPCGFCEAAFAAELASKEEEVEEEVARRGEIP